MSTARRVTSGANTPSQLQDTSVVPQKRPTTARHHLTTPGSPSCPGQGLLPTMGVCPSALVCVHPSSPAGPPRCCPASLPPSQGKMHFSGLPGKMVSEPLSYHSAVLYWDADKLINYTTVFAENTSHSQMIWCVSAAPRSLVSALPCLQPQYYHRLHCHFSIFQFLLRGSLSGMWSLLQAKSSCFPSCFPACFLSFFPPFSPLFPVIRKRNRMHIMHQLSYNKTVLLKLPTHH